jgi:iron complex outermembrane recepter protein
MKPHWTGAVAIAAVLAAGAPAIAVAADTTPVADTFPLAEIVVTAQKREEKLKDVPIAMTVVGAGQLQDQNVTTIADLSRTAPALEMIQSFGGPGGGGQIRGIGTQSFTRSAEGAVGIVVDGVSQGNLNINNIFDTSRVEVLRGPQGTLFGLTSSAGVINMVTNAPDPSKFESIWHAEYANKGTAGSEFGQEMIHGVVNIPISGNSALRVAGSIDDNKGVQHNSYTGQDDTVHNSAVRARYLWRPTDDFTVNVIGDYQKIIQHGAQGGAIAAFTYVTADPTLAAQLAACGITAGWGNQDRCANHNQYAEDSNYGASVQLDWNLGGATLTSISAYRRDLTGPNDQDIQALPTANPQLWQTGQLTASHQWSQELRATSNPGTQLDYTVGVFFSDYFNQGYQAPGAAFNIDISVPFPPFTLPVGSPTFTLTQTTSKSQAAFAHLEYHLTDVWTLIGGLRYTHEKITDYDSTAGFLPGGDPAATNTDLSEDNVSGVVGVQYKITPAWTSYATVTRGYKGPQAQAATAAGAVATIIPSEIPLSYEVGFKGSAFEGRVGLDFSLFNTRVQNYQGQTCVLNAQGVLVCNPNSFDVTTRGAEIDFYGKPLQNLNVNGGFIYDDATYPSGYTGLDPNNLNGGTTNMGGLQLVGVPKEKFILSADYTVPLGAVNLVVGADTVYKSDIRLGYSADPRFVFPSSWNVGLRAGIRSVTGAWGVTAFARDVNNSHEPITLFGGPAFYGPPPPAGPPFFFNPAYPNGAIAGVSGWIGAQSLREVGLSVDFKF